MIVILMGVSGSGKTRVGSQLAQELGWEFLDSDDYHSPNEVRKMASGIPLTEHDREPWLQTLKALLRDREEKQVDCIFACSALTDNFRRKLTKGLTRVEWVHLHGDFNLILERMEDREDHFFKSDLLGSQFATLEMSEDIQRIDVSQTPDEIVNEIRTYLDL